MIYCMAYYLYLRKHVNILGQKNPTFTLLLELHGQIIWSGENSTLTFFTLEIKGN